MRAGFDSASAEKRTPPVQPIAHCYANSTTLLIIIRKKNLASLFIIILKLVFHFNNIVCKNRYFQYEVNIKFSGTFSHFKIGKNKTKLLQN
jgi:hypothetical protein